MYRDRYDDISNYAIEPDTYLDVPFVPTEEHVVETMLNLAQVTSKDVVYDLGSGDGRILITAARERGARGIGIDIDPLRVAEAMEFAGWSGVECMVDFLEGNIFDSDVSEATVVSLYLLQTINVQLRPQLLKQLRPGSRIVSHAFDMGDWQPDEWVKLDNIKIFKWVVPAPVAGTWEWLGEDGRNYRVELTQKYQEIDGRAWRNDTEITLDAASLSGGQLELTLDDGESEAGQGFMLLFSGGELKSVEALPTDMDR